MDSGDNQPIAWESSIETIPSETISTKPEFQKDLNDPNVNVNEKDYKFSETVSSWTDFMYARYHPRSINLLPDYQHNNIEDSFDCYTAGTEIWSNQYFNDEFDEKIRQYIEECNNCQGFQMLFDCSNGFSGVAMKCLEQLSDDYSKTNFAMPIFTPKRTKFHNTDENLSDSMRMVNIAMTYANLIDHSTIFLPLSTMTRGWRQASIGQSFPLMAYDQHNLYETSAILATYLDSISMRWRTKSPTYSNYLSGFCSDLNNYGRKMIAAGLSLPFAMRENVDLIDCLDQYDGELFKQLSPNSAVGTDRIIQSVCIRGITPSQLKRPRKSAGKQMQMAAYKCDSVSEMLQLYFQCNNYASLAHVMSIQSGMPVATPYPSNIFDKDLNSNGFLREFVSDTISPIESVPVLATAQVSNKLADTLETLHRDAERVKIAKLPRFTSTGLETDEYKETLEKLLDFKDIYDDICPL